MKYFWAILSALLISTSTIQDNKARIFVFSLLGIICLCAFIEESINQKKGNA